MNDDKTARDYNIEGGSVLHLVSQLSACFLDTLAKGTVDEAWPILQNERIHVVSKAQYLS